MLSGWLAMGLRGDDCRKILHAALAYADGPDDAETMIDVPSGELAISSAACDGAGEKAMWLQPARPSSTPEHRGPPTPGADEGLTFKTQVTKYRVRVLWCTELGYAGIFARWLLEPAQR